MLIALLVGIFLLEVVASLVLPQKTSAPLLEGRARKRVGILIPAHDEEEILAETIVNLQRQLRHGDWLLVVADNCSDGTEAVAKGMGADVIVRTDPANRGKGFALDYGVRHFATDPPEIVIVIDADCKLDEFAVDRLAAMCEATKRPTQALYVMTAPADAPPATRVREFAWRVKNWVRPLGLSAAGLPCQLMGTGMAFPWETIASANLASGALAEDLKLGLELAALGRAPIFCPLAKVTSEFPAVGAGSRSQQTRWERGHLAVIAADVPPLLLESIRRRNLDLLALALDAAVPPLSLLAIMIIALLGVGLGTWLIGMGAAPFLIGLASFVGLVLAAAICWASVGRDLLSAGSIVVIGAKSLAKIPFYLQLLLKRGGQAWIRTDRRRL